MTEALAEHPGERAFQSKLARVAITLATDDLRVEIDPLVGASVVDFAVRGPIGRWYPLFRRCPKRIADPIDVGSFLMCPWPNRVAGGTVHFRGQSAPLRPQYDDGSALHGEVYRLAWRIDERTPVSARLSFDQLDHPGLTWPWPYTATQRFELEPGGLIMEASITNRAREPMPAGLGHHMSFTQQLFSVDDEPEVTAKLTGRYPIQDRIPTGPAVPEEVTKLLAEGGSLRPYELDDVFDGFDGHASVRWPTSNVTARIETSENQSRAVIFHPRHNGSPLPFFCFEPQTMINDAVNLADSGWDNTGLTVLEPGETLAISTRLEIDLG